MEKKITIIALVAVLVVGMAVAVTAISSYFEQEKNLEQIRKEKEKVAALLEDSPTSAFGMYDDKANKEEKSRTIQFNGKQYKLKYDHTNNHEEVPVKERSDAYGTYDIYLDDNNNEFRFLYNSDLLCAMTLDLTHSLWTADKNEPIVSEEEALKVANDFFEENLDIFSEYELLSCSFSEMDWQYTIRFVRPVSGYESDDTAKIWITSTGEIVHYSVYNLNRYADVNLSQEAIQAAEKQLIEQLDTRYGKGEYSIDKSYVSKDDDGYMILVYEVVYKVLPDDDITALELFHQRIGE